MSESPEVIQISSKKFVLSCAAAAIMLSLLGWIGVTSVAWLAVQLGSTILGLFLLGSFKYQLDKNALTYGMLMVILGTFFPLWWPSSALRAALHADGVRALWPFVHHHALTLHGLESLIHADTMLFILGLTFFVSVIAQTRLLETISNRILRWRRGRVFPTVLLLTGMVAVASGILDGVSMIGLMIRTLVIILALGHAEKRDIIFAVIVSTVITTVSGMWMAYGEPPNLIMKANLFPHLDNLFFLKYCLPVALGSYVIVALHLRRRLGQRTINIQRQDILDSHNADVRFLQASRHGEVFTSLEFVEHERSALGPHYAAVRDRLLKGESLGEALIRETIDPTLRRTLLGRYTHEDLGDALEQHYQHAVHAEKLVSQRQESAISRVIAQSAAARLSAQRIGAFSFIPFIGLLVAHGIDHAIPLFLASFAGFGVAFLAIRNIPAMRSLALREAAHEYKEYLFLFPLFLSISLLQRTGFFDVLSTLLHTGIDRLGVSHVAYIQYWGACLLSAILDNNVVADFASKALHGLDLGILYIFSAAQIAGYAVGGCWTHIGCAQSVVAFAFIKKEINPRYTPLEWIKAMTVIVLQMSLMVTLFIYLGGWLLSR